MVCGVVVVSAAASESASSSASEAAVTVRHRLAACFLDVTAVRHEAAPIDAVGLEGLMAGLMLVNLLHDVCEPSHVYLLWCFPFRPSIGLIGGAGQHRTGCPLSGAVLTQRGAR
jgi:hypothetical protein